MAMAWVHYGKTRGTMTLTEAEAHLSHTHTASALPVSRSYASWDMPGWCHEAMR